MTCRRRKVDTNPAANRYGLPSTLGSGQVTKQSYPSYSMTPQREVGSFYEDLTKTPGPGQHKVVPQNSYNLKLPEYSMQGTHAHTFTYMYTHTQAGAVICNFVEEVAFIVNSVSYDKEGLNWFQGVTI